MSPQRYRELRESKGIGVRELARLLGLSPGFISQVETGEHKAGYALDTSMRMALALKLNQAETREVMADWRTYHLSEITRIDSFINGFGAKDILSTQENPETCT